MSWETPRSASTADPMISALGNWALKGQSASEVSEVPLTQLAQQSAQISQHLQEAAATLRANATNPHYYFEVGTRLLLRGKLRAAEEHFRRTLQLDPEHLGAWCGLIEALRQSDRLDDAQGAVQEALAHWPQHPRLHRLAAQVARQQKHWHQAARHLEKVLCSEPENWQSWWMLGQCFMRQGLVDQALRAWEQACRIHPLDPGARWAQALLALQQQRWAAGWPLWQWRPARTQLAQAPSPPWARWQGEPLEGKTLLVRAEPRTSWNLALASWLPGLKSGGQVWLQAPQGMEDLWRRSFPWAQVCQQQTEPSSLDGEIDYEIFLGDLPLVLDKQPHSHAWEPVLIPSAERKKWAELLLGSKTGLRVGLVWRPAQAGADRLGRALSLTHCQKLLELPGINWVPLVPLTAEEQTLWHHFTGQAPPGELLEKANRCWDTMAALVACLDLVVGVPTIHVHLAGALAVECWVLVSRWPSWMWPRSAQRVPWYPQAQLFHQTSQGHWTPALESVQTQLAAKLQG